MQKVLIITYYWPPAGGPGVQRWLKFVKYLPECGIEPIVFIPENPTYPITDKSLLDEIPEGVRIIKKPIFEPYGWASIFSKKKTKRISSGIIQKQKKQSFLEKAMLWVRGNLFIPDARKYWVKSSSKSLSKIILEERIKTIITTGPPHSVHLIGLQLKNKLKVNWVADFRDPWTSIGYHKKLKLTKASQKKHKALEFDVLNTADTIITTSTTTKVEFEKSTSRPISVITNGFEGESASLPLDSTFTLSHIGSLLTDRNPMVLWQVLAELISENEALESSLKIQLVGIVGDGVKDSLEEFNLLRFVEQVGYVSHEKVLEYQARAQALLLLEIDSVETRGIIPGKLFEYLKAGRPILAIGPEQWEAGLMVQKHSAGHYVNATQKDELKKVLLEWFSNYQRGKFDCNSVNIDQYHRRALTQKLAKLL